MWRGVLSKGNKSWPFKQQSIEKESCIALITLFHPTPLKTTFKYFHNGGYFK